MNAPRTDVTGRTRQADRSGPMSEIVINGRFLSQRTTGVQRVAREITVALDRLIGEGAYPGLAVRIVAPTRTLPEFSQLDCRNIAFEEASGALGHAWEQFVLPRHVRGGRLLCLGNSAPIFTLLSRRPPAVMLHDQAHLLFPDDYSLSYRVGHRLLEAVILRRAAPVFLVSEAERIGLAHRNPIQAASAIVVPNGSWSRDAIGGPVRLASRTAPLGYGLFVGSPTGRKNIDGVLAVAVSLARDHGCEFKFVGPALTSLSDQIPADLRGRVQTIGYISDADMPGLYRNAAFLLYPSYYEASGLPPSEAMSFGCPVIASDLPVLRERLGEAAIYCNPDDHAAIKAAAERLLFDSALAAELSRSGLARVAGLTWQSQAAAIVQELSKSLTTASPSQPLVAS